MSILQSICTLIANVSSSFLNYFLFMKVNMYVQLNPHYDKIICRMKCNYTLCICVQIDMARRIQKWGLDSTIILYFSFYSDWSGSRKLFSNRTYQMGVTSFSISFVQPRVQRFLVSISTLVSLSTQILDKPQCIFHDGEWGLVILAWILIRYDAHDCWRAGTFSQQQHFSVVSWYGNQNNYHIIRITIIVNSFVVTGNAHSG